MNENYIAYVNSYNKLVSTDSTSNFTVMINLPKIIILIKLLFYR